MASVKHLLASLFFSGITVVSMAQVGIGTNTPHSSAKLEINSSNKGFLPPRVTLSGTTDVSTIASPATGLFVYNTATAGTSPNNVTPGLYYYDGSKWQRVINQQPDATVSFDKATPTEAGVAFTPNTPASTDYIYVSSIDNSQWTYTGSTYVTYTAPASTAWYTSGSTTNDAGSNKTGGIYRTGNVGIGTTSPSAPLEVGTTTGSVAGLIVLNPTTAAYEGGQVTLKKAVNANSTLDWTIDQYQGSVSPWTPRFRIFAGATETNGIAINESGTVGIGHNTQGVTEKFYVNGTTKLNGNTTVAGTFSSNGTYFAIAGLTTDQSVSTSDAILNLTDYSDLNNWWDGTNHRFQPNIAGYYYVSAMVSFQKITTSVTNPHINIQIRLNGNSSKSLTQDDIPTLQNRILSTSAIVYLNGTTDYVELTGYASQSITINGNSIATKMEIFKLN